MQYRPFRMERRAPWALAVQAVSIGVGLALLAAQQFSPLPTPAACGGAAQIVYEGGRACHAALDTLFRALAAQEQPGCIRAIYVRPQDARPRPGAAPAWLRAEQAIYLWRPETASRPGALAAYAAPSLALAAQRAEGGQVLRYRDVVEHTVRLVTKD